MSYKNNNIPRHVLGNSNILPQSHKNQSMFNLSEDLKTTINFDYLYPVFWEELSPGDRFKVNVKTLGRLMPMVAPIMSNVKLKYFAFFVPNRLLWENWNKFMGEKLYQTDHNDYTIPQVALNSSNSRIGRLGDYMGVCPQPYEGSPPMVDINVSALPFRAYNKIWNEWFRASELQDPVPVFSTDDGDYYGNDDVGTGRPEAGVYKLLKKSKPLDYFTSCLPYPQSGEPVMVPLTGDAPVKTTEKTTIVNYSASDDTLKASQLREQTGVAHLSDGLSAYYGRDTHLFADMSQVTGVSIEMLRKASALQVLLEKDARAGETYIDLMNVHYGTSVPDFLVGRSQYLGSSTTMLNIEPIAQTGATTENSPQGNLASLGIGVNGDDLCEVSAVEHGIFMVLACADGELSYSQGVPRKFSKVSRYDYMFPEFHNLGDQAVLNKEIFISGNEAIDNAVFGYQERYRELRESTNKLSGLMRHGFDGTPTLDVWHLGQKFNNTPTLCSDFIECNTPIDRVLSVPSEHHIVLNTYFDIQATRTLPVSSNPSLLAGRV